MACGLEARHCYEAGGIDCCAYHSDGECTRENPGTLALKLSDLGPMDDILLACRMCGGSEGVRVLFYYSHGMWWCSNCSKKAFFCYDNFYGELA